MLESMYRRVRTSVVVLTFAVAATVSLAQGNPFPNTTATGATATDNYGNPLGVSSTVSGSNYVANRPIVGSPQVQPRVGVLARGCSWAYLTATRHATLNRVNGGLHFFGGVTYPTNTATKMRFTTAPPGENSLDLQGFLEGYEPLANCVDMSSLLVCIAAGVGIDIDCTVLEHVSTPSRNFTTSSIAVVGWSNFQPWSWAWHQIGPSPGNLVTDACASSFYSLTGSVFLKPPTEWPLNDYWQLSTWTSLGLVAQPLPAYFLQSAPLDPVVY